MIVKIFENAKFGDKFRTRDGRRVLYLGKNGDDLFPHCVYVENEAITFWVQDDGSISLSLPDRPTDIVGKFEEPINKEEFDRLVAQLADKYCKEKGCGHINPNDWEIANDCIKIGYNEALNRVCEWLSNHLNEYVYINSLGFPQGDDGGLIYDFLNKMKGE